MPNGVKMTGAKHTDRDMIIYDTPQESRTSRGMMLTSTSYTNSFISTSSKCLLQLTTNQHQQVVLQTSNGVPGDGPNTDSTNSTTISTNFHHLLLGSSSGPGLRDQVVDRQVAVDMEEGTK